MSMPCLGDYITRATARQYPDDWEEVGWVLFRLAHRAPAVAETYLPRLAAVLARDGILTAAQTAVILDDCADTQSYGRWLRTIDLFLQVAHDVPRVRNRVAYTLAILWSHRHRAPMRPDLIVQ